MSVQDKHIMFFGSSTMPQDDTTLRIGGAEAKRTKVVFSDLEANSTLKAFSDSHSDTSFSVLVTGRSSDGTLITESISLDGTTANATASPQTFGRLLRAEKSVAAVGNIAVISSTVKHQGTLQYSGLDWAVLDSTASSTDGEYSFDIIKITSGLASGDAREIAKYDGSSAKAYMIDFSTAPGAATYEITTGMLLDSTGAINQIEDIGVDVVTRIFYLSAANPETGSSKDLYEKIFCHNLHTALAESTVVGSLFAEVEFALCSSLSGTGGGDNTNGNNARTVAPSSSVSAFDSTTKNLANSQNLSVSTGQGVWLHLYLSTGAAAQNSYYRMTLTGQSI